VSSAAAPRRAAGGDERGAPRLRLLSGGRAERDGARRLAVGGGIRTSSAILAVVAALCLVGLVMVLSASAYTSLQLYGSVWTVFERQVLWMALGGIALWVGSRVRYDWWRRVRVPLLLATLAMLFAVLVPGVGLVSGGSSRWIGVGLLRIQPSELMKLALVVFVADLLTRRADRTEEAGAVVVPVAVVTGFAALLLLKQPDMGTAMVLVFIAFALLFAGGVPLRYLGRALGGAVALGAVVALAEPYRRARLLSFLHPLSQRNGNGYQVVQSLVGLGNGHLFGLGLGDSRQKWGLLPNPHTDFIFSVIGEETGLIGTLVVLTLFLALAWFGIRAATRAPDRFGMLAALGITAWITVQAVINIGAVIGVLPVTGIPLPFVSFGGSSLVITMFAAGVLVNIAGHERRDRLRPAPSPLDRTYRRPGA
jgi:cell division protein FtsW